MARKAATAASEPEVAEPTLTKMKELFAELKAAQEQDRKVLFKEITDLVQTALVDMGNTQAAAAQDMAKLCGGICQDMAKLHDLVTSGQSGDLKVAIDNLNKNVGELSKELAKSQKVSKELSKDWKTDIAASTVKAIQESQDQIVRVLPDSFSQDVHKTIRDTVAEELQKAVQELREAVAGDLVGIVTKTESVADDRQAWRTPPSKSAIKASPKQARKTGFRQASRRKNADPDHFMSGIKCFWKREQIAVQNQIVNCFASMNSSVAVSRGTPKANLSMEVWDNFFFIPDEDADKLENWPYFVQDLVKMLPDPCYNIDSIMAEPKYAKFVEALNKLRSPFLIAVAWERMHYIVPDPAKHPDMISGYVNGRLSRTNQLRTAWNEFSIQLEKLVRRGVLPATAILDPCIPLPVRNAHPWLLESEQDEISLDELHVQLAEIDKIDPKRIWFLRDIEKHPSKHLDDQDPVTVDSDITDSDEEKRPATLDDLDDDEEDVPANRQRSQFKRARRSLEIDEANNSIDELRYLLSQAERKKHKMSKLRK